MNRFNASYGMAILLNWRVVHRSRSLRIDVGGKVDLVSQHSHAINNLSYFFCVSEEGTGNAETQKVLRKYHFDYTHPANPRNQPQPIFHLQHPGTLPNNLESLRIDHMDPWLEEPRLFCSPMSLAMLLHVIFREFPNRGTERLRQEGNWLKILKRDQKQFLVPFYQKCLDIINQGQVVLDYSYES